MQLVSQLNHTRFALAQDLDVFIKRLIHYSYPADGMVFHFSVSAFVSAVNIWIFCSVFNPGDFLTLEICQCSVPHIDTLLIFAFLVIGKLRRPGRENCSMIVENLLFSFMCYCAFRVIFVELHINVNASNFIEESRELQF